MAPSIRIKNISELPIISGSRNDTRKKISCITIGYREAEEQFSSDIHLDAFIILLVLSGKGHTVINYKAYDIQADTLLLLSSAHLFHFYECSDDFQCQCLFVSKAFTDEMDSTDMIYRRTKYGVRLYNQPVVPLAHPYAVLLAERLASINKNIDRTEHFYHKEVILNRLFAFYLDLSDILERTNLPHTDGCLTRYESIIKSFIELLATHYREEHKVDFYAAHLNLSAHHLTQIVKLVTGQSVSDFIFEMLFSEARNLLTHSKLSIQEIATTLNFSDHMIVYTSADSVLQICGNEETFDLEELYRCCKIARELTLKDEWKVGRVIARPYVGKKKGEFKRTSNRHDYALKPFGKTALNALKDAGFDVISIGKINDIFDGEGITKALKSKSSVHGMEQTIEVAGTDFHGLCFVNLVDFDALWGHRR